MKILIYFSGDIKEPKGTPIRVKNIMQELDKNGAAIYYAGKTKPENINVNHFIQISEVFKRPFVLSRFVRENGIDLVYIQTSAGLWLAPFLQFMTKAKIALDYHSLLIEEERIYKKLDPLSYFLRKYLDYGLSFFLDFATGVSSRLAEYYKKAVPIFHILPGGVNLQTFNDKILPNVDIIKWKGNSILIGYAGNTKWYQGLDTILSALLRLQKTKPNTYKLFIVASSIDESVISYIEKNNLCSIVKIFGKHSHNEIPSLLMSADILAIVRPRNMVTEYAFPSKFPEYAALGKALIVSRVGDIQNYVEDGVSGVLIDPGDKENLFKVLLELEDKSLREKLGKGSTIMAKEKLDINNIGNKLYKFLYEQG